MSGGTILHIVAKVGDLHSMFLRFQEYYESPKFAGTVFTEKEFREWHITEYGETYENKWAGFNIPDYIITPFKQGVFNPLSKAEKTLLKICKPFNRFYIIGSMEADDDTLKHEMAHAAFYLSDTYRHEVTKLVEDLPNLQDLKRKLVTTGYTEDVLVDEIQAYAITTSSSPIYIELNTLFTQEKFVYERRNI
jgi:hypothetical protein